ncbi:hypothetical protein E1B28_008194 [Marasmius oreades]|uniref:EXPERA domain-containing protein n=1 Tax=Marasmius oreades TaxID=181124 RepID=A0A9P7US54_9AGAR|nr:uncharacterized protein E1B28_008194 [Marasmius oreades]KAG7091790.1 hypothetical protein E1B28_008194 [Marasmius oreades]
MHKWYLQFSQDGMVNGRVVLVQLVLVDGTVRLFQVPAFVLGIHGLLKKSPKIYPLLCLYGASTATTTLPCLLHVTKAFYGDALTTFQYGILVSGYTRSFSYFLVWLWTRRLDCTKLSPTTSAQGNGMKKAKKA